MEKNFISEWSVRNSDIKILGVVYQMVKFQTLSCVIRELCVIDVCFQVIWEKKIKNIIQYVVQTCWFKDLKFSQEYILKILSHIHCHKKY